MKAKHYVILKFYNGVGIYTVCKRVFFGLFEVLVEKCESEAQAKQRLSEIVGA